MCRATHSNSRLGLQQTLGRAQLSPTSEADDLYQTKSKFQWLTLTELENEPNPQHSWADGVWDVTCFSDSLILVLNWHDHSHVLPAQAGRRADITQPVCSVYVLLVRRLFGSHIRYANHELCFITCQHETWRQLLFHTTLTIRYQHFQSLPFQIEKEGLEPQDSQLNSFTCNLLPCSGSQALRVYVGNINKLLQGKAHIALQSMIRTCSLFSFKCKADKYLQD